MIRNNIFSIRFWYVWIVAFLEYLVDKINNVKNYFVVNSYWGRGGLYKSGLNGLLIIFTLFFSLNSFLIQIDSSSDLDTFASNNYNYDILAQGDSLYTVLPVAPTQAAYQVFIHKVVSGESLDSIAKEYSVSKDTIKWANSDIISPYNDSIRTGWNLKIPEINGVLYTVKTGDTLAGVINLTGGNKFDIVELNSLAPPYNLKPNSRIFIPDGELPPPPPLIPSPLGYNRPSAGGYIDSGINLEGTIGGLPIGFFDDPLTHPQCANYVWIRGFYDAHKGVDLASYRSCPIRAAGSGTVSFAGWFANDAGYTVIIDHGGGVATHYYHGTGDIWVRTGQTVNKGQDIMQMGCTGNCRGVHLHLTMRYNGKSIDPAPYIPYRR